MTGVFLFHCTNSELRILAVLSVLQHDLQYADIERLISSQLSQIVKY